jgi:hypothetical protein
MAQKSLVDQVLESGAMLQGNRGVILRGQVTDPTVFLRRMGFRDLVYDPMSGNVVGTFLDVSALKTRQMSRILELQAQLEDLSRQLDAARRLYDTLGTDELVYDPEAVLFQWNNLQTECTQLGLRIDPTVNAPLPIPNTNKVRVPIKY